jgi:hypothetical protein
MGLGPAERLNCHKGRKGRMPQAMRGEWQQEAATDKWNLCRGYLPALSVITFRTRSARFTAPIFSITQAR